MKIQIINGANLNLLGIRENHIYGEISFEEHLKNLKKNFINFQIDYFQSNLEGEIINKIQEVGFSYDGIILNAGAYTHTSLAIADAISSIKTKVIEVHISNIFAREKFRQNSLIAPFCKGSIIGFGLFSYNLALNFFEKNKNKRNVY